MPRPHRELIATERATATPPAELEPGHVITRVVRIMGKNLYSVAEPAGKTLLVELPARFRSTIWIKRGGFVIVDKEAFDERENKLDGEIVNVIREEKQWRKQPYW
jgi:probable RNA-binding protein EIF1AD